MTDRAWPDNLPDGFLEEGFSFEPQNNVIRTSMDAGPKKARRRYTASAVNYTGRMVLNEDEMETFKHFYHITLADGVLRFYFKDPITNGIAEFRFTEKYTASAYEGCYDVRLPLERL